MAKELKKPQTQHVEPKFMPDKRITLNERNQSGGERVTESNIPRGPKESFGRSSAKDATGSTGPRDSGNK